MPKSIKHCNNGENDENGVPGGWVKELSSAESAAKQPTPAKSLRAATAALKLRIFDKASKHAQTGLDLKPTREEKSALGKILRAAKKEIRAQIEEGLPLDKQDLLDKIFNQDVSLDNLGLHYPGMMWTNLNYVQAATMMGDVNHLQLAISLGAALDYEVSEKLQSPGIPPEFAPTGATALVLCSAFLALASKLGAGPAVMFPGLKQNIEQLVECGVLLVMHGADCSKRFEFETPQSPLETRSSGYWIACTATGLRGKSARELADISGQEKLINAMKLMATTKSAVEHGFCRCGSRLPWKACHGGQKGFNYCLEEERLMWRYTPLARCPCLNTKKSYFKCCWKSSEEYFQDDHTGVLKKNLMFMVQPKEGNLMAAYMKLRALECGGDENALLFPRRDENGCPIENTKQDADQHRSEVAEAIRTMGILGNDAPYVTKKAQWDPEVIAGVVENIDNFFVWIELHWKLPKSELLVRTKEWNDALDLYCDKAGLSGEKRKEVIAKHNADPLAPCGNPACSNREKKVKGFKACARCKSISYCSKDCQRVHWKSFHKRYCIA